MVLEVRLSNFFSIKEEVVLDLRAANIKSQKVQSLQKNTFMCNNERLLKTIAIYGANASGKSNVIKAVRCCVELIVNSHNYNENVIFNCKPFKFDGYEQKPSSFLIRFIMDNIEYEYSFSVFNNEIITENLYHYPAGRRALIFSRDESKGPDKRNVYTFQSVIKRPFDVANNTSCKTLFISRASQMDRNMAKEVYRFFNETFIVNPALSISADEINKNKKILLKALQIADSDITDIMAQEIEEPAVNLTFNLAQNPPLQYNEGKQKRLVITTIHKNYTTVPFDFFTEESKGTQLFLYMMIKMVYLAKSNKIFFIDEIETSLHTKLVEYFINIFNASESAQLIFTTHNTNLLNLNKMRKDQIYFVNKNEDGASDVYSLFDYKDFRDTMDVEKAYLQGRFDAIPYINESAEILKTL